MSTQSLYHATVTFMSKDVHSPFSLNEKEVSFNGKRIATVLSVEKISNKMGSRYTVFFNERVTLKGDEMYLGNSYFADLVKLVSTDDNDQGLSKTKSRNVIINEQKEEDEFRGWKDLQDQNLKIAMAEIRGKKVKHLEKKDGRPESVLIERINEKIKDWSYDNLFDLYDYIAEKKQ